MPTEVKITISSPDSGVVGGGSADMPPSPLSLDALGAPEDSSAAVASEEPSGQAPTPLPLNQLLLESSSQESAAPTPSPLAALSSDNGGDAPSPMPLEDLQHDRS